MNPDETARKGAVWFTIGLIGNETGYLLKSVKLYGNFINIRET